MCYVTTTRNRFGKKNHSFVRYNLINHITRFRNGVLFVCWLNLELIVNLFLVRRSLYSNLSFLVQLIIGSSDDDWCNRFRFIVENEKISENCGGRSITHRKKISQIFFHFFIIIIIIIRFRWRKFSFRRWL